MCCGPRAKADAATTTRRVNLLREIVAEFSPSLVALQEAPSEPELRVALGFQFEVQRTESGVASVYDTRSWSCDRRDISERRIAVFGLLATGAGTSLWMLNVHGPGLFVDEYSKQGFVREVATKVRKLRESDANRREIIVGDVNLPPFDISVMRSEGLYASRCLPWVSERSTGIRRALFNPTWSLLAHHQDPSGTFYRSDVSFDGPWCAVDQVIVSAELARDFSLDIIDKVRGKSLRRSGHVGMPDVSTGSDHLPLLARLRVP
jgi:endonuclease/exonuclease/phosphatase family metal-dependent hydrolase